MTRFCAVCCRETTRPVCTGCELHAGDQDLQDHESQGEDT